MSSHKISFEDANQKFTHMWKVTFKIVQRNSFHLLFICLHVYVSASFFLVTMWDKFHGLPNLITLQCSLQITYLKHFYDTFLTLHSLFSKFKTYKLCYFSNNKLIDAHVETSKINVDVKLVDKIERWYFYIDPKLFCNATL